MNTRGPESFGLTLAGGQLDRVFPFFMTVDAGLHIASIGPSLRKIMPGMAAGDALLDQFQVIQPKEVDSFEHWQGQAGELVLLASRRRPELVLRGSVEALGEQTLVFLLTAVVSGFEQLRALGLGLKDFALHDSVAETLRVSRVQASGGAAVQSALMQLRAEREQLGSIIEQGDSGILYASADGVVRHANRTLLAMFGIDDSRLAALTLESFGRHLGEMLAPDDGNRLPLSSQLANLHKARADEAWEPKVFTLRLAAPRRVTLRMNMVLTPGKDVVLYFRDITSESEVDRMKSEFLSTAAHELRTPLASIFGFAELMMTRKMSPEKQQELLATIHRQSQLLVNLINELLDLARIEARQGKDFHRQFCRVSTLVEQTIRGLLIRDDKRQVVVHLPHGAVCIMVDLEKSMQALLNVISNAFKYSPQGGEIAIDTQLKAVGPSRHVGIRVTDHGIGMNQEQLARIFERFYRADPSGVIPGTGLGLSLVKEIVELQEGHVEVESIPDQGSRVTLWFPVTSDFVLSRPFELQDLNPQT